MAEPPVERELMGQIRRLTPGQQQQVLGFIHGIQSAGPVGIPGRELVKRARELNFDPDELERMKQAIEEGCEGIDWR